jgi:dTDP-4-amino-4,6-dideoxygalactose transaminase
VGKLIPFNVPFVPEISKQYVLESLESNHQQGDGPFTTKSSKMLSNLVGGGHVLLTPSCTHALEMASMLANIGPGDEVILPSYTFTSAATAVTKFGATPVFVDVEMNTKGIDVNLVREAISPRTKAISWVNYAGIPPDIEGLQGLAKEFDLLLIEDNAHGLGGFYKGKPLGSFGDFATQSFHATKNIQCGEGGALIINNKKFIERAEIIREKGTNRSKYVRGELKKYQWVDNGSSYLLAEPLAAILTGQLENFNSIQFSRKQIWNTYFEKLSSKYVFSESQIHSANSGFENVAHIFYFITQNAQEIHDKLLEFGVNSAFHYQALHSSEYNLKITNKVIHAPISSKLPKDLLRLPIYPSLELNRISEILDEISWN